MAYVEQKNILKSSSVSGFKYIFSKSSEIIWLL